MEEKANTNVLSEEEKQLLQLQIQQGIALSQKLFEWHKKVCDEQFGIVSDPNKKEANRKITAKTFLLTSGQLGGQIAIALSKGCLLLAAIGQRSLVEYLINAKYIFNHPKHKGDVLWMGAMCDDFFLMSRDRDAIKNRLNNTSIKQRAKETNLMELYENDYASLCNYAHLTNHAITINEKRIFSKNTFLVLQHALCVAHDVGEMILDGFELVKNPQLESELTEFRNICLGHAGENV